jgi:putative ABC transport system ATP-binding protein
MATLDRLDTLIKKVGLAPRPAYIEGSETQKIKVAEANRAAAPKALIDLHGVTKIYESEAGPCQALKSITLQVHSGEFVAVVGKSGSGKSTLINLITGIDRPTSGELWVAGFPIHKLTEGKLAVWRGRSVGVVFQFFQLLPTLTVVENVMLPMDLSRSFRFGERKKRAMRLLEAVEISDQARKLPANISGGQQQRVAIARALANDPPVVVADEPTGNLDSHTSHAVVSLFERLVERGKTVLMVTHDMDLALRAGRLVQLADGLIVSDQVQEKVLVAKDAP